jgi:hypothetical protein
MSHEKSKTPTPAPQEVAQTAKPKAKKFSFSLAFFRKSGGDNAFGDKVAPSKRELEERATKRKSQKAKLQGGLKLQPVSVVDEPTSEEEALQPA